MDSERLTLRATLQLVESNHFVDFQLGGHTCQRPPEVVQGRSDDRFNVTPEAGNELLFRSNSVQVRNLKHSNLASFFPGNKLEESAALMLVPGMIIFKL